MKNKLKGAGRVNETYRVIIDYIWIPILGVIAHLYSLIGSVKSESKDGDSSVAQSLATLEERTMNLDRTRKEDIVRNDGAHAELKVMIGGHHDKVMAEIREIHRAIKNGRGGSS